MKKKILIVTAILTAISATGDAAVNIANMIGDGFMAPVVENTNEYRLKTEERLIMYNGDWIPISTYEAFLDQIASTEVTKEIAAKEGRYFDAISEWVIEWGEED